MQLVDLKARLAPGTEDRENREIEAAKKELAALNAKLQELGQQLQTSADNLLSKEQQVEQYKAIATSNEEALADLTRAYDSYKESTQRKIDEVEAQIQKLGQAEQEQQATIERLTSEAKAQLGTLETQVVSLGTEKQDLTAKLERLERDQLTVSFLYGKFSPFSLC